jgi:predicted nucleic acid-binding protein
MYIDTSVAVKLYVEEPDSEACEAIVAGATLVSSRLLYCEFRSALLGKASRGAISADMQAEVWQAFRNDITADRIHLVSLNDALVHDAADLLAGLNPAIPVRTLDALHLATFMSIDTSALFTRDARMRSAAAHLGLPLAD